MNGKEIPVTTADGKMRTSVARPDGSGRFGVKPQRLLLAAEPVWLVLPAVRRLFNGSVVAAGTTDSLSQSDSEAHGRLAETTRKGQTSVRHEVVKILQSRPTRRLISSKKCRSPRPLLRKAVALRASTQPCSQGSPHVGPA